MKRMKFRLHILKAIKKELIWQTGNLSLSYEFKITTGVRKENKKGPINKSKNLC